MDAETVARQIELAFAGMTPPGDEALLHPECLDDCDVLEFYGGVPRENTDPVYSYAALGAMSAQAFAYYLPAFMLWTLRNPGSPEYAGEALLRHLDPGTPAEQFHEFSKSRFALLDVRQVEAVRAYLNHMASDPDLREFAEAALVNYWLDA